MSDTTAARALADAATHGPWEVHRRDGEVRWITQRDGYDDPIFPGPVQCMAYCYGGTSTLEIEDADAEFIAAARTLVPELCDEVERLRAERAPSRALPDGVRLRKEWVEGDLVNTIRYFVHRDDLYADPSALIARELGPAKADVFLGLLDEHGWTVTRKGER